jgi:nickel-dependent lactate racemase
MIEAMKCRLSYGKTGLSVTLPDRWDITVLAKKAMPVAGDPRGAVTAALEAPIGSGTLEAAARGRGSACILVCDFTRPVPNGLALRPIVERLTAAGIGLKDVTIVVATGLHRPNEGAELANVIGDPWILDHVRVVNHFARNDDDHAHVGTTSQGIPVRLDKRFLQADVRIVVGLVEPHFMAGWSGGRKVILPGIAHADTIAAFHAGRILGHPMAATCVLEGNPLHEAQQEMLAMIGPALAMNFVIDQERRVSTVTFGGIRESHAAAVQFADPLFRIMVPRRFPVVLSSCAGYPLDATYYQTGKGISCGAAILQPGGDLFVASECAEGLGSPSFRAAQERLCRQGKDAFRAEATAEARTPVDEWGTFMLLAPLDTGRVHLFSEGLDDEEHDLTGVLRCRSLEEEIAAAVEKDPDRRLAVIPEGPYVAPVAGNLLDRTLELR